MSNNSGSRAGAQAEITESAKAFAVNLGHQIARRVFASRKNPASVRLDLLTLTNIIRSAIDIALSEAPRLLGWQAGNAEEAGAARGMRRAIVICDQVVAEYAAGDLRIRDWTAHEVARRLKEEIEADLAARPRGAGR